MGVDVFRVVSWYLWVVFVCVRMCVGGCLCMLVCAMIVCVRMCASRLCVKKKSDVYTQTIVDWMNVCVHRDVCVIASVLWGSYNC